MKGMTIDCVPPGSAAARLLVLFGGLALALALPAAQADEQQGTIELPSLARVYVSDPGVFRLAAAEQAQAEAPQIRQPVAQTKSDQFEPSMFTASKMHQYLGLATIAGVALTTLTAPDDCESNCSSQGARQTNGTHAKLAKATLAMAVATVVTGILVHHDDIDLAEGLRDPDNLHALLGVTGAALMAYAVNRSKNSAVPISHAGIAEAGALLMVAAIKITW